MLSGCAGVRATLLDEWMTIQMLIYLRELHETGVTNSQTRSEVSTVGKTLGEVNTRRDAGIPGL